MSRESAFTLIEVLFALMLLSCCVLSTYQILIKDVVQVERIRQQEAMHRYVVSMMESLHAQPEDYSFSKWFQKWEYQFQETFATAEITARQELKNQQWLVHFKIQENQTKNIIEFRCIK